VGLLRRIGTGAPQWSGLNSVSAAVQGGQNSGFVSVHATRLPTEVVVRSYEALFRVDLSQDKVLWRMAFKADQSRLNLDNWFQMLRSIDAIAIAARTKDDELSYKIT